MSREPLIIVDGYNLMHQILDRRFFAAPGGLERARQAVVQRVASLLPQEEHAATTVVFDASGASEGRAEKEETELPAGDKEIQIVFASEFPDADSRIEDMIRQHSAPVRLTVVSSDRRLVDAARRRGAAGKDCQTWLDGCEEKRRLRTRQMGHDANDASAGPEDLKKLNPDESRYWMREFGFDPPDSPKQ